MTWLQSTPSAVVQAFVTAMPRLEADERRAGATIHAVGKAIKPGQWVRKQLDAWDRAAGGNVKPKKASKQDLRAIGIGVRKHGRVTR